MAELDHVVLGASTLEEGAAFLEQHLGASPVSGGQHAGFGTHNLLLGLGSACYLEVIAADPAQRGAVPPRLFGLDEPDVRTLLQAGPRLVGWVARTVALDAVAARLGPQVGKVRTMRRGELEWRMAVPPRPESMDGLVPALIEWRGGSAAGRIPDSGCRLLALEFEYPMVQSLRLALEERGFDVDNEEQEEPLLRLKPGPQPRLVLRLRRADGVDATIF